MCSIGNAPVSYGAFELTVGTGRDVPDGLQVLDRVQSAGYRGVDLGPVGYLGRGDTLASNLESHQLGLTGGYLELPFHDDAAMPEALRDLVELLAAFDVAKPVNQRLSLPMPRPTIAVTSQAHRRTRPGRSGSDRSLGYSTQQWRTFATNAEVAAEMCREQGYDPVFHNEVGTNVEADWEVERMLELTTFNLCLDTGHLIAAGGDPVSCLRQWAGRVTHLHLKSADRDRMRDLVERGDGVEAVWARRVFRPLGEGDLDVGALVSVINEIEYEGWLVVEQDIFPDSTSLPLADEDQRRNREVLRDLGY